eukprot:CAMPEP_0118673532 /NCGR_PEP_ID=MMETSP0800-20121206/376_1 /TAXON_ID=210618 ORGANISM="Striatella unipunctata, Strain CCMP2910" /NCGR_SAMPLE_ID=MMETSP0800 /ASSEMBLY_ACC=CAM_ASM_000638 /LENGTH=153 /DNA_ID=CAMNT_0006568609 /DNA_START=229 /DNA_END=690 /DNA_ORIENTATION=-
MVKAPDSLVWEMVKGNSCFLKKVNGHSKRSGVVEFSTEKGNLYSLNSAKNNGLSNTKAVDVVFSPEHGASLVTKTASKAHSFPKKGHATIPLNKHFRATVHTISSQAVDNYYRPDLKKAALAKYSCVYRANRVAKGIKKALPVKKGRYSKSSD